MIIPTDAMHIETDTCLKPGVYYLPNGLDILEDGITLDGSGAVLVGKARNGSAVRIHGRKNVTVMNLRIIEYKYGIDARRCQQLTIAGCKICDTAEVQANTIFLDVWRNAEHSYGGGILLEKVNHSLVQNCDLQHQMNGLHAYHCNALTVRNCNASYNSGWGFHLYETCDSIFDFNYADYCCRYEPRSSNHGHLGADSAGFLIVHNSCRNIFRHNYARLSGDGFFLAGMSPATTENEYEPCECNNNLFEDNDASLSPNIAFEATFSQGNIFRHNHANRCNYGFWLGFSTHNLIEENEITANQTAGIAVENGVDMCARSNQIRENRYGVLIWSKRLPTLETSANYNETSRDWLIESNQLTGNGTAIRIAANQDHGIKALPETGECGLPSPAPKNHVIRDNHFHENGQNFDLHGDIETIIE
jgi:parallel beta-helix repeat protein